ncbi:MAG: biopolymer transporter ExbD [Candidatus Acidiferrales bacterium]
MAYKPKVGAVMAAPNVIPMADIMLVLLIIMMVITPMLNNHQLVDMAKAKNWENMPAAERDDAVVLAVTRDGNYYLGNNQIALNQITSTVEDKISNKLNKTVYVRSDENAKYGDVKKVIDAVRDAGVDNVGLLTLKDETGAPQPPAVPGTP